MLIPEMDWPQLIKTYQRLFDPKASAGERFKSDSLVYFMRRQDGAIKIGTSVQVEARKRELEVASGPLDLLGVIAGSYEMEARLHQEFRHLRTHGEWFRPGADLLAFINKTTQSLPLSDSLPEVPTLIVHGTRSRGYKKGCRCGRCVAAQHEYRAEYDRLKTFGNAPGAGQVGRGLHKAMLLTPGEAAEIRGRYTGRRGQVAELAREYGVRQGVISAIVRGVSYRAPA